MDEYINEDSAPVGQEAMRRLRGQVWSVRGPEQQNRYLVRLRNTLDLLVPGLVACRLYRVDKRAEKSVRLSVHPMTPDGCWQQLSEGALCDQILRVWREARSGQRPIAGGEEAVQVGKLLGRGAATICEMPFEQGVLVAYGRVGVLVPEDLIEDLQEVCQSLFCRLEDMEQLQKKEAELRHIQRLQVAGKLTAETAHEINNHLSVVIGESSLLREEKMLDPLVIEGVETIYKAGLQARDISERLLNFVRGQKAEKKWINFNRLVQESAVLVRRTLQNEQIEIVEKLAPNLPWIAAHLGPLQQIALNLIQNSRDAIQSREGQGRICLRTLVRQGWVVLEVEDDGPGIPKEIRPHIFEPFFTTKNDGKGTGLGLSVCTGIARDHGGRLLVDDREDGAGACMILELPVQQATMQASN